MPRAVARADGPGGVGVGVDAVGGRGDVERPEETLRALTRSGVVH